MTKPSLFESQGRDAPAGSSLRCESALHAMKPWIPKGKTEASVPPASITSASPRRMWSMANCGQDVTASIG